VKGWTNKKTAAKKHQEWLNFYKIKQQTEQCRIERVSFMAKWINNTILDLNEGGDVRAIAIEGYAFGRGLHRASSDLHELGGLVKAKTLYRNLPLRIYPPSVVKKAWTGSGSADKAQMQMACFRETGVDYTEASGVGDGLADAVLIAKLVRLDWCVNKGLIKPQLISEDVLGVLMAKTKAYPTPLYGREFIGEE
jgi:Holliday junction resolvasome RuvABC endonuclease subunit